MDSTRFELVTTSMSTKYATTAPTVHGGEKRYGFILPSFCSFVYWRVVLFAAGGIFALECIKTPRFLTSRFICFLPCTLGKIRLLDTDSHVSDSEPNS